jgi:hypothetical protein
MPRRALLRTLTIALAFVHSFPASKHLAAFAAAAPWSADALSEAWKGVGAALAVCLYLLPVSVQVRALAHLWRFRRLALKGAALVLVAVHLAPARDHVPRLFAAPNWADGWRGVGSVLAIAWFVAPLRLQARLLSLLGRMPRLALLSPHAPTKPSARQA